MREGRKEEWEVNAISYWHQQQPGAETQRCVPTVRFPPQNLAGECKVHTAGVFVLFFFDWANIPEGCDFLLNMTMLITNQHDFIANLWNVLEFPKCILTTLSYDTQYNPGKEKPKRQSLVISTSWLKLLRFRGVKDLTQAS